MKKVVLLNLILVLILSGCVNAQNISTSDNVEPSKTVSPMETVAMPEAEEPTEQPPTKAAPPTDGDWESMTPGTGGALTIGERRLKGTVDHGVVLEEYEDAEWQRVTSRPTSVEMGGKVISWQEQISPADADLEEAFLKHLEVLIFSDDEPLMTIPTGTLTAGTNVYGIYSDGSSWYLEVDRGEAFYRDDNTMAHPIVGDIYRDGVSLNEAEGYDECFGFTILSGKPFYFFVRDEAYYYHYDGMDYPLNYTHIIHHLCCSGAMAEPRAYEDRVIFFAFRDIEQYLAIIGDF